MNFVVLVLTSLLASAGILVAQSPQPLAVPEGVQIQSFEFRPVFRTGVEEKESVPTNAAEPRIREGSIGSRPMPGGDPSIDALRREPPQERYGYEVYLQLKNSGPRAIKKLAWDFLFLDPGSGSELKKFSISSKSKIRSGEVKFLTKQVLPSLFLGGHTRPEYARGKSAVVIRSIEYADGSKWEGTLRRP